MAIPTSEGQSLSVDVRIVNKEVLESNVTLSSCVFDNNRAYTGGAIMA